jgi:shikimate dehydrogenase
MQSPIIRGNTRLVGLLGDPVEHSLSPLIHNHAFAVMELPYAYVPLGVSARDFHTAVWALRAFSFVGANVTVPYKQKITPYCDTLSPLSAAIGAVNTIRFHDGLMHGDTTDAEGFFKALAWMGHDPANGRIVILGNGGVARTLAFALALNKIPRRLTLIGRDRGRVSALSNEISLRAGFPVEGLLFSDAQTAPDCKECSLLVNCTSVGMHPGVGRSPIDPALLHAGMTVFDTIYNPATTKLLSDARRTGCAAQNGLRMLLYQGLASLAIWTGRRVSEELFDVETLRGLIGQGPARLQSESNV